MRSVLASILVVLSFTATRARAGDVAYQLEVSILSVIEQPSLAKPLSTLFEERAWAVPGLEEFNSNFASCSTGWPVFPTQSSLVYKVPDPVWPKEEQLWPKTQAMWGRGEYYRKQVDRGSGSPEIYYFGSIGLQR